MDSTDDPSQREQRVPKPPADDRGPRRAHVVVRTLLELPEINVLFFGFLINLPWELLQVPYYEDMALVQHLEGIRRCMQATAGDAGLLLIAYWIVAMVAGRRWLDAPRVNGVLGFVAVGLVATVLIERLQLGRSQWTYLESMPIVPLARIGLWPFLQWVVLPPLLVGILHRQLRRADAVSS